MEDTCETTVAASPDPATCLCSFDDFGLPNPLCGSWNNATQILELNGIGRFPGNDSRMAVISLPSGICDNVSILLFGDENPSHLLRLLMAGELSFYAEHDAFNDAVAPDTDFFPRCSVYCCVNKARRQKFSDTGNREETIKEEAFVACEVGHGLPLSTSWL